MATKTTPGCAFPHLSNEPLQKVFKNTFTVAESHPIHASMVMSCHGYVHTCSLITAQTCKTNYNTLYRTPTT
jgi:hypothetical protein